jgi:hypothetical protein
MFSIYLSDFSNIDLFASYESATPFLHFLPILQNRSIYPKLYLQSAVAQKSSFPVNLAPG